MEEDMPEPIHTPPWSDIVMYWPESLVAVAFQSDVSLTQGADKVMNSLRLDDLAQFLKLRGFGLKPLDAEYIMPSSASNSSQPPNPYAGTGGNADNSNQADISTQVGKYLFASPLSQGTTVVCYFQVEAALPWGDGNGGGDETAVPALGEKEHGTLTQQAINTLNHNLDLLREDVGIPIHSAMTNWLCGTSCFWHGGSATPPFPVPAGDSCAASPGNWHISLPDLSSSPIGEKTGKGVTVFVLDTMPSASGDDAGVAQAIKNAASKAGDHNHLLNTIAAQLNSPQEPSIKFHYTQLAPFLSTTATDQQVTGRDLHGKKHAFYMEDHGLFVTGIIRDLAPDATIEYVRVLNDFGVGDCCTFIHTLEWIHGRMSEVDPATGKQGDLYQQPVVINMSLVSTPADVELVRFWFQDSNGGYNPTDHLQAANDMRLLRAPLQRVIQELALNGAVMVGAAGNDSFTPYIPTRIGPRYPAAFPEVISVGAVDRDGQMASYSNYPQVAPQHNGIATYGGTIPRLSDIQKDDVDAVIGVYSSATYPALEANNPVLPDQPAPNENGWAYWSGTSFATPIISAVAARVLENLKPQNLPARHVASEVQWALTTPAGQKEVLGVVLGTQTDFAVSLLKAEQCQATKTQQSGAAPAQAVAGATKH
jgi:hypothetical protein